MLTRGAFQPFAIFDKPDPLDGPFFEETHLPDAVTAAGGRPAARSLTRCREPRWRSDFDHGPVHAECRVNRSRRVRARSGGAADRRACARRRCDSNGRPPGRRRLARRGAAASRARRGRSSGYRRESQASGVMMIPIPQRGISARCRRHRRGAVGRRTSTRCGSPPNRTRCWCRCRRGAAILDSSSRTAPMPRRWSRRSVRRTPGCGS